MAIITLSHFGNIDSEALEEYYDAEIEFHSTFIQVDLNFEKKSLDPERLDIVRRFIDNIRIHDLNNKKYIQKDFDDMGDTVPQYIDHHLAELALDDLENLIGTDRRSADKPDYLLEKLHLVRVGLYPDSKEQFAIFDYSIGRELTDYLLVVYTDENGNLEYLSMES